MCVCVLQDVELKVAILELVTECVSSQPGMMELFLKIQPAPANSAPGTKVGVATTSHMTHSLCVCLFVCFLIRQRMFWARRVASTLSMNSSTARRRYQSLLLLPLPSPSPPTSKRPFSRLLPLCCGRRCSCCAACGRGGTTLPSLPSGPTGTSGRTSRTHSSNPQAALGSGHMTTVT